MKRVALWLLASAACSTSPHFAGFTDSADGSSSGTTDATPSPTSAHVRFADWSPDALAPGFSFCLLPQGAQAWMGPFQPNGLAFPGTSTYSDVPPGSYDAQAIPASSGDCSGDVTPTSIHLPALAIGTYITVAAIGDVTPTLQDASLKLEAYVDDEAGMTGSSLLRVINAAPSFSYVNIGTGSMIGSTFRLLFASVTFGIPASIAAGGQMFDANGYAQMMPMSGIELSVQPLNTAGRDVATASNVSLAAGAVQTFVIIGGKTGGAPAQIMMCDDAAAARGSASACNVFNH
jgi:hypothetical protein